jgi:hypothetical protein
MDERKQQLLKQLEAYFQNDEDIEDISLFTKEELGTSMDVLRALITGYGADLTDVLAEFSFLPFQNTEVLYFNTVITIRLDVPQEGVTALSGAVSKLNFYLPYGNFAISCDGSILIYKSSTAFPSDWDDNKLYELIETSADIALSVAESHIGLLSDVADGKMSLSEFTDTLPQV